MKAGRARFGAPCFVYIDNCNYNLVMLSTYAILQESKARNLQFVVLFIDTHLKITVKICLLSD